MKAKTAQYYDKIYSALGKNYEAEASRIGEIISDRKKSPGHELLDVACGTALHSSYLCNDFEVSGIDVEPAMLEVARDRFPGASFEQGDMRGFDLGRPFDVVMCLFGSIGFMKTESDLDAAIATMARHVAPGGVLLIEPWLTPDQFTGGNTQVVAIDEPELKLARVTRSELEGCLSILDMQYLIATSDRLDHIEERYELGLFAHDRYVAMLIAAGLEVSLDPEGLASRGLFICTRPLP